MRKNYLSTALFDAPIHYALFINKKSYLKEIKKIGLKEREYPILGARTDIYEEVGGGNPIILVLMSEKEKEQLNETELLGVLIHESVHVWQMVKDRIGEENPSPEFEAYCIQSICENMIKRYNELDEQVK